MNIRKDYIGFVMMILIKITALPYYMYYPLHVVTGIAKNALFFSFSLDTILNQIISVTR